MKIEKIVKVLALSQSPNDAEALSAIRMANNMLKKEGCDWQAFMKRYLVANKESRTMKKQDMARTSKFDFDNIMRLIDLGSVRYRFSGQTLVEDRERGRCDAVMLLYERWERELREKRHISVLAYDCLRQLVNCNSYSDYESVIEDYRECLKEYSNG